MQGEAIKKCIIINSHLSTQMRGPNYVLLESETGIGSLLLIKTFDRIFVNRWNQE